jgi:parallel beta-helix repeat protein
MTIDATGNGAGVFWSDVRYSRMHNLRVEYADTAVSSTGIALYDSYGNRISDVAASNNTNSGIELNNSWNNTLSGVTASNNHTGVYLGSYSDNNTLSGITVSNNYIGISLDSNSDNNTLSGITAFNSYYGGIELGDSTGNTLSGLTASNNSTGVYLGSYSSNNTLTGITVSNNHTGVYLGSYSDNNTLSGVTAGDNTYGVWLDNSSDNYFTGALQVGGNLTDCYVTGGGTVTNPGLDDDLTPGDQGNDAEHTGGCIQEGASDFGMAVTGITLASSFVGKVASDDTVNTSDASGTAIYPAYPALFDWTGFENSFRGWGLDGSAFPNADNTGIWTMGTGRIWDWSAMAGDTVIANSLSYPDTGDMANTLTHSWYPAFTPTQQSDCDADAPGSIFVADHCETTFLRSAVEIMDDGIGNDNTLCETDETCLYTPNMGSYQGHGALVNSSPAFTDGAVLTGITLKQFETNGY